jgi:hypothetical protein
MVEAPLMVHMLLWNNNINHFWIEYKEQSTTQVAQYSIVWQNEVMKVEIFLADSAGAK